MSQHISKIRYNILITFLLLSIFISTICLINSCDKIIKPLCSSNIKIEKIIFTNFTNNFNQTIFDGFTLDLEKKCKFFDTNTIEKNKIYELYFDLVNNVCFRENKDRYRIIFGIIFIVIGFINLF